MSFDLFCWFSCFTPPLYCFFVQSAVVTLNCNNGPCYFFERWFLESFQFLDPPTYWNNKWKCMLPFVSTWLIFPFFTSFAIISCSLGTLHLYTLFMNYVGNYWFSCIIWHTFTEEIVQRKSKWSCTCLTILTM